MNADTTALARELVKAPGFRWMAGMRVLVSGKGTLDGDPVRMLFRDVYGGWVCACERFGSMVTITDWTWYDLPDLDDPGTEGCLQRILDESGCEFGTTPTFGTDGRRYCIGPQKSYPTRGQALARAIIAAGKAGGEGTP